MLVFTNRSFETLTLADTPEIPLLDDELNENTDTGTAILSVKIPKINKDVEKIEVGNFVFATDYKEDVKAFEVIELEETRHYKDILAEDTGLDLLNDEASPIKMSGTLEEFITATLGSTSAWEIGFIEINPKKRMTLEYTAPATQTKRIAQIAGRFGCEVSYNFEFQGNTVAKKLVNFHVRRGKDTGRRLEIGKEIEDVKRKVSITDLCTAVRPIGQTVQKVVKTAIPFNLLNDSNRETTTRNYKVGQWTLSEPIRAGDEVTLTFKGVIGKDQRFRIYNSGSNHALAFLENVKEDIYSATFLWSEGDEGNTSLWAYQYPDKSPNNSICKIEWAVLTREKQVADKWVPSIVDEMGRIAAETKQPEQESPAPEVETIVVTNSKIDMLIAWFTSKEGRVGYDQNTRQGPRNYDCSSAVSYAARHAGFMPNSVGLPATGALWDYGNAGRYFHQISKSEVRRGDLFVSRTSGSSRGGTGHTGIFLSPSTIIHCTVGGGKRGIMRTPATSTWFGAGVRFYRWNDTEATKTTTKTGDYWTSSDLTKHDLGKTLQGITATQLNNWIKAVSPSSPFNGNGDLFLEAQRQSGLDVRYIIAHAAHESAWGTSNIARKNKNYFGIGAIDSDPFNGSKKYANADLATGIINGVNWIKKNYYNRGQTTLYKMRFNGGVHEYATDTAWHTKIANIMKKSEKYTQPAKLGIATTPVPTSKPATGALIPVPEVKYEDKTVEVDTTLVGYQYDDGRYVVNPAGEICDREGLEKWGRFKGVGVETWGYILRVYESEAQTPKTLFQAGLNFLKKNNTPRVEYEIGLSHIPEDINLGDTVRIIDHDYQPALYLEARLIELTISKTNPKLNKATFSNFEEKEGGILDRILELQDTARSVRWDFDTQPYNMNLISRNGNIFKDGLIETTLIVELTKAGINQVSSVDKFTWERISEYPDKVKISDEVWNDIKSTHTGNELTLNNDDIDLEATFICQAIKDNIVVATATYNIKDLTIGIFTQEEEPDRTLLSWGDIWKWDDGTAPFKRVWKGDRWEDTVTMRDLELLELTPGPPGADGEDGLPGPPGENGKTSYVHFAYADSADGVVGFTRTATDKKYIGMYVDFTQADSEDPSDYAWSLFKGADGQDGTPGKDGVHGLPGEKGTDGKTSYVHFAYADSADGKTGFSLSAIEGKAYIGMYTDFVQADSEDPEKYHWSLFKGEDGQDGEDGIPGKAGEDGKTPYFHTAWATNSTGTTGFSTTDSTDKTYIGTYTDFIQTDSTDSTKYKWVKIKGEDGADGIPGKAGADGKTPYFHQAWANSADGITDFSTTISTDKIYIGTYVDFVQEDSEDPGKYKWIKVKGDPGLPGANGKDGMPGEDGKDGLPGENGKDGRTSYVHFAYADSDDGSIGFTKTATVGKKYIGMYVDFTESDSDDPSDYAWSLFKGEDGTNGIWKAGADGKTPYFHTAYANSSDGNVDFSTEDNANKTYIGTYVDYVESDSDDPDKYKWIRVRGNDGEQGPPGTDGKTGSLGRNLLKNSNILIGGNSTGRLGYWELDGDVKNNEEVTVTLNADLPSDRWVKLFDYNESTELATLTKNENGLHSATFLWKTINTDKVSVYIGNMDPSYMYTTIDDYQQSINNGTAVQDKNYGIMYGEDIPDISAHYDGVEYDFNWITLQRGDIPALDWSSSVEEIKESIDEKTGEINTKVEELEVHLQQYPPAESITKTAIDVEKTNAYLEALKTAIESDALTLQDRLAIIEANVGAGKLSIEAITTYFEFGEEGVLIGKQDEQVKLNLSNNALEIIDGDKVVARFANNQTETPNLKVLGVFEFGYHMASKMELNNKKYTVIRPV